MNRRPGNSIHFGSPTEAPAKADLRNKFRYCCGGSAIRASSIALAFGRSWGWVKPEYAAKGREEQRSDLKNRVEKNVGT